MTHLPRSPSQLVNPLARQRFIGYGTAPGGSAAYAGVLDSYTSGMIGWWDVGRALVSGHTGRLIRVRSDAGGSPEMDIGINPATGLLDTAALLTFAGSNSCFVKDIVSSYGTLTQATAARQMRIVNAGSLVTDSSGRACMEAPSAGRFYYSLSITADATFSQIIVAQPVSTTGSACFGGAFRTGDSDLWGIGQSSTNWQVLNSVYGSVLSVAGAASGSRKSLATCFSSVAGFVTWKLRQGANTGAVTFSGTVTGSSVQLGSQISGTSLRSGDKVASIVHFDSALADGTLDALNTLLEP
jgi:hypothetical protein